MGFCVASTKNGRSSGYVRPAAVTWCILHRFEERRLRFRRRPVDFVGEDDLREDRPGHEPESAVSVGLVEHLGAGDVGGHEVWRELDRLNDRSRICATVLMSSVLASPGTPVIRQCPPVKSAMRT